MMLMDGYIHAYFEGTD